MKAERNFLQKLWHHSDFAGKVILSCVMLSIFAITGAAANDSGITWPEILKRLSSDNIKDRERALFFIRSDAPPEEIAPEIVERCLAIAETNYNAFMATNTAEIPISRHMDGHLTVGAMAIRVT